MIQGRRRAGGVPFPAVLVLPVLAGLWGCATSAGPDRHPGRDPQSGAGPDSTGTALLAPVPAFDPWRLPESPLPDLRASAGPVLSEPVKPQPEPTAVPAPAVTQPAPPTPADTGIPQAAAGWTVQLYCGPSPARARAIAAEARLLFPEHPVELLEEESGLRVRVGRFDNRESAEGLSRRAVRLGFEQAWITGSPRRD